MAVAHLGLVVIAVQATSFDLRSDFHDTFSYRYIINRLNPDEKTFLAANATFPAPFCDFSCRVSRMSRQIQRLLTALLMV
jgi:hypothetical protein